MITDDKPVFNRLMWGFVAAFILAVVIFVVEQLFG